MRDCVQNKWEKFSEGRHHIMFRKCVFDNDDEDVDGVDRIYGDQRAPAPAEDLH